MRIIVGGMNHESNTLNPIITGKDDFVVFRGKEILEGYATVLFLRPE